LPQSSHKTMKKNNMIKSTKKRETMKKTFKISVAKFHSWVKENTCDELRKQELTVKAKDWIDAIIEHNKVFRNNTDIESYLLISEDGISITQLK